MTLQLAVVFTIMVRAAGVMGETDVDSAAGTSESFG